MTGVSVTGADRVAFKARTVFTADVAGTGVFSTDVTWSIASGAGRLSAATGTSVTYTAPFVQEDSVVTVQAVSQADPSKSGLWTFTVGRAPVARLVEGVYEGPVSVTSTSSPESPPRQQQYTLEWVSDTQLHLSPILGFPKGVRVDVSEDGTLVIPPQDGPATGYDKYCFRQQSFIGGDAAGTAATGTWDVQGNLTLRWSLRYERECIGPGGPFPGSHIMYAYQYDHVFTGVRLEVPRPPAATFLEGIYYLGNWSFTEETTSATQPPSTRSVSRAFSFTIERESDTRVRIKGLFSSTEGVPVDVFEDGTLEFLPYTAAPQGDDRTCERHFSIGEGSTVTPGTGTWDRWGNLTLDWLSRSEIICAANEGSDSLTRTTNTFVGRKY
ncbi:hypothetical protein D7X32_12185 [Corallococcus carmarthensis]|uniref:Uncharacterized protein n=1 Tax=Corallococcus carmarthensis TaxID=2316728 RepID=A0A3A8KIL1_9BACT|nr:hypothetical protein D7X32_12185 [Corallococcus carmarthensis]